MRTRIQKWGNSLAVRIPKTYADESGLSEESEVELSLSEGKLVVTPVERQRFNLEDLLAQITDENRHGEVDMGRPVGREVW